MDWSEVNKSFWVVQSECTLVQLLHYYRYNNTIRCDENITWNKSDAQELRMRVRLFEINAAVRLSDEWRLFEQDNTFFYSFSFSFCKQKFQIGFIAKIHFPLWMKYWHFFFFFKFAGSRLMWKKKCYENLRGFDFPMRRVTGFMS